MPRTFCRWRSTRYATAHACDSSFSPPTLPRCLVGAGRATITVTAWTNIRRLYVLTRIHNCCDPFANRDVHLALHGLLLLPPFFRRRFSGACADYISCLTAHTPPPRRGRRWTERRTAWRLGVVACVWIRQCYAPYYTVYHPPPPTLHPSAAPTTHAPATAVGCFALLDNAVRGLHTAVVPRHAPRHYCDILADGSCPALPPPHS